MRRIGRLAMVLTGGVWLATARESGAQGVRPLGRLVVGAPNPDALEKTTMAFGVEAGLALGARTTLLARALRQSQNRNSGADLSHEGRDLFSVLVERSFGSENMRRRQYVLRVGAGAMLRPHLPTAPVATLGLGIRYPIYRGVTLVGSLEDDVAALAAGTYTYSYTYFDPNLLMPVTASTTVVASKKLQNNFGILLAVEWRP